MARRLLRSLVVMDIAIAPPDGRTDVMVGIDVGATTISAGLVTRAGEVLWTTRTPTHGTGPGTAVDALLGIVHRVVGEAERRELPLIGIGVGLPSIVDVERGTMVTAVGHVPEFADVPIAERIESLTGVRTFADNDANALALAEWRFGAGRRPSSLVLLAIGTEVGGGVILDGRVVRGHDGWAGELGHVPIDFRGPQCLCGGRGCLGVYVGGRPIAAAARRRLAGDPGGDLLARAGGDPAAITCEHVFAAAAAGDPIARDIVDEASEALGAALGLIVNALNPEVIVVTGGVAASLMDIESEIRRRVRTFALAPSLATTTIVITPGDKASTVRGGAALVLYELERRAASRAVASGPDRAVASARADG